jgi:hypothetical protein
MDNKKRVEERIICIYEYLLSGKEKFLNIRAFTDSQKREAYERQNGIFKKSY